jgi:hypothetical protein
MPDSIVVSLGASDYTEDTLQRRAVSQEGEVQADVEGIWRSVTKPKAGGVDGEAL